MNDHAINEQTRWRVTDIDICIARKLRNLRVTRGIHPQLLDCAIGAPPGTVWRYEEGGRPIPAAHLYRLSNLLDTPLGDFFCESTCSPCEPTVVDCPALPPATPTPAEVQRFVALYAKLDDPQIRQTVGELLRTLSNTDS